MSIRGGFHGKRQRTAERPDRQQVIDEERGKATLLKRISSQYDWAKDELSEIRTLLAERKKDTDRIDKLMKQVIERQREIKQLMESVELDEETLQKAAKYDDMLSKTRDRMRRTRSKKK